MRSFEWQVFFYPQHICPGWWTGVSTNNWYSNGYDLCSTTRRFVSYEADFLQGLLKNKDRKLAQTFNFSICYIYDVLSLKNSRFGDYLHHSYPNELEVNDTTDTQKSAPYLDLHLEIDNEKD